MSESRKLGIIGGLSWVSTRHYYERINTMVSEICGKQHSANLLISSLDFQPVIDAQVKNNWGIIADRLSKEASNLQKSGASGFLIASNTIHLVLEKIKESTFIPALSIFDAISGEAKSKGISSLGLLGTKYTMTHEFFVDEYAKRGIKIVVPDKLDRNIVNEIIFRELIHGNCRTESAEKITVCANKLMGQGAGGILLGCTELSLLTRKWPSEIPFLDSTELHCRFAVEWLLTKQKIG